MGRMTIRGIAKRYREGRPITMVTCYDATFARLVERAAIDAILVGDSLGNVIQGHETTLPVELEDIVYHTRAVARGNATSHLIADLPFMSYQAGEDEAMRNAGALVKRAARRRSSSRGASGSPGSSIASSAPGSLCAVTWGSRRNRTTRPEGTAYRGGARRGPSG